MIVLKYKLSYVMNGWFYTVFISIIFFTIDDPLIGRKIEIITMIWFPMIAKKKCMNHLFQMQVKTAINLRRFFIKSKNIVCLEKKTFLKKLLLKMKQKIQDRNFKNLYIYIFLPLSIKFIKTMELFIIIQNLHV